MQVIVFGLVGWDCDILLGVRHPVLNLIQDWFRGSCPFYVYQKILNQVQNDANTFFKYI